MRKKLNLALCLLLSVLLCACAVAPTAPATQETTAATQATTIATTAATQVTETTAPLHSPLYLPQYTTQQVFQYFEEVVLQAEYSDGTGDTSLVQKWLQPLRYRIYGDATETDLAVLTALFDQLNEIPGFPGIYAAEEGEPGNFTISFLSREDFNISFQEFIGGEDAFGAARFWYYTATNEIHTATVGYRTDMEQASRNSVLVEEIINTLGISDTTLRTDSIVYQYSDDNTALSDMDLLLLNLLYDPSISCSMDVAGCRAAIEALYY